MGGLRLVWGLGFGVWGGRSKTKEKKKKNKKIEEKAGTGDLLKRDMRPII